MKKIISLVCLAALLCLLSCGKSTAPEKIKVLIVPKFEVDEMAGDFPGEAQLFYEKYCAGENETALPHLPDGAHFYLSHDTGAAILVTGSGKTSCALALTSLFSCPDYDLSDTLIVSVGCAGGSAEYTVPGDVVIVTAACDNELGHTADIREFADTDADVTWFHDGSYDAVSSKLFDRKLAEKAYELASSVPLRTTEVSKSVIRANFPSSEWAEREPVLLFGTALSGDSYWKGEYGHRNAEAIVEHYSCPDPYAVTEMEDLTVANVAECYGLAGRVVTFRVVVDLDVFLGDDTPESLWNGDADYNESVSEAGSASIDIFEPAMYNLFDAASPVIDAALRGDIE